MADAFSIEIRGLKETQKAMEKIVRDLNGPPMVNAMRTATLLVVADAKKLVPVDTGRLRASITPQVVSGLGIGGVQGIVGSVLDYAPYIELGTRPHWPPIAALEVWAARHGTSAFLVARAISQRGTKAYRFLQNAFLQNKERIFRTISAAVQKIVQGRG